MYLTLGGKTTNLCVYILLCSHTTNHVHYNRCLFILDVTCRSKIYYKSIKLVFSIVPYEISVNLGAEKTKKRILYLFLAQN